MNSAVKSPPYDAQQGHNALPDRRDLPALAVTAGLGLPATEAFPARLQARLKDDGIDVKIVNAGVSGDTTTDGLARVDWALADKPDFVILALGANDALRGIDPKILRANLLGLCASSTFL
jgi:lysophospholipase L1-like esterase